MKYFWILSAISIGIPSNLIASEEIFLKCDELERNYEYVDIYCTVTNFEVSHSQQVRIQEYPVSRTNNTKFMKFYDSTLLYIPHKLFERFPHLKNLDVSYSEVIEIPRNTFTSADDLSYFNCSHNNITEISGSVFNGGSNLLRVDLSYNQIVTLNKNAFKGLSLIDRISLSGNRIKLLDKNLFLDNTYLEAIFLDNNQIEFLEPDLFSKHRRIREIDLTNNLLKSIDPKTFQSSYSIEMLLLSGNQLTDLKLDIRTQINRLQVDNNRLTTLIINSTKYVNAEQNKIRTIENLTPIFLEKLYLAKNELSDIQNITNLSSLYVLDLSYNNVGLVNISTFEKMKRLKELHLRGTHLSGINFGTFSKQSSLEVLDLSFNNLQQLNVDIFVPYMIKMKKFFIDGNNLTEISGTVSFSYAFPNLVTIGLSKNNFNCSYLLRVLTAPFLSSYVELHIEPENSTEISTHIRDISCVSDAKVVSNKFDISSQTSWKQKDGMIENEDLILKGTIERMTMHEKQLQEYLMLMKIFVGMCCAVVICSAIYKIAVKISLDRRNKMLVRSIAYRSSATVNTINTSLDG